jgi:hypothetical protein
MSTTYGVNTLAGTSGRNLCVGVEPTMLRWKPGGATLDWAKGASTGDGTTALPDGTIVPNGVKYFRYGTVMAKVTATGKYGAMDTSGSDGRETVTAVVRGERFILNRTVLESELGSEIVGSLFDAGIVFKGRVLMGGTNQPTEANVETMLPGITFHND